MSLINPDRQIEAQWYRIQIESTNPNTGLLVVPWETKAVDLKGAQQQAENAKIDFARAKGNEPHLFSASVTLCPRQ